MQRAKEKELAHTKVVQNKSKKYHFSVSLSKIGEL